MADCSASVQVVQENAVEPQVSLENLPTELQELVCRFLDGNTLLRACCVSKEWNCFISSLQSVWHNLCQQIGTGPLKFGIDSWKIHYIHSRKFLHHLKQGSAFQHRNFIPENFRGSTIRGLAYIKGHLIAGIHNRVQIWQVSDVQSVAMFEVPYKLSCLAASQNGEVLGMGCHNGTITTWQLHYKKQISATLLQEYFGHTNIITSLDISTELDILCSGSSDGTVRLWNLHSATTLWTLATDSSVLQITVLSPFISLHKCILLVADEDKIQQFCWMMHGCKMVKTDLHVSTLRRFLVHKRNLVCVRDSTIVLLDAFTGVHLYQTTLECTDVNLVAIGARLLLVITWNSSERKQELVILDLLHLNIIGSYHMPFCRPEHIVMGDINWLNQLSDWKPGSLVVASSNSVQGTDCFYIVTWR